MGVEEISIPREIEADGFITRKQDLRSLERTSDNTARPTSECCYPKCEECKNYVRFRASSYCSVPMVINKQVWTMTTNAIAELRKRVDNLENDLLTLTLTAFSEPNKKSKEDDERELYDKTIMDLAGDSNEVLDV